MARDWKYKVRNGRIVCPKMVVDTSRPDVLTLEYRELYPGVKSDHLPPVLVFHSRKERNNHFKKEMHHDN